MGIRNLSTASVSTGSKRSKVWDQNAAFTWTLQYTVIGGGGAGMQSGGGAGGMLHHGQGAAAPRARLFGRRGDGCRGACLRGDRGRQPTHAEGLRRGSAVVHRRRWPE